jgi:hypothetical protein
VLFRKSNKAAKKKAASAPIGDAPVAATLDAAASGAAVPGPAAPLEKPKPAAPLYRKPEADLYTVLLVLALLCLIIGCVYLYMDMKPYKFEFKGAPTVMCPIRDHISQWASSWV